MMSEFSFSFCHHSASPTRISELVFVVVLVGILFNNIEFDGIEADDLQISSALFT